MVELYRRLVGIFGGLSIGQRISFVVIVTVVTTAGAVAVVVLLPVDHFQEKEPTRGPWHRYRVISWAVRIVKNVVGLIMLPLGILMALPLVPGPGLVFILIALSLLDFPGKRTLELKLLTRPAVLRYLNEVRTHFGRPPLNVP